MSKAKTTSVPGRKFTLETLQGKGVRGKYFAKVSKGSNVVKLDPEIAKVIKSTEVLKSTVPENGIPQPALHNSTLSLFVMDPCSHSFLRIKIFAREHNLRAALITITDVLLVYRRLAMLILFVWVL